MNRVIVDAIEKRRRVTFTYHGKRRLVEPQCYGLSTKGNEVLRAHQLEGGDQREPLFDVSKLDDLAALVEHFIKSGSHYKKNDSAMTIIFAQL